MDIKIMKNTVDFFINKFENIPEENWCTGTYWKQIAKDNATIIQHCAFGHCLNFDKNGFINYTKAVIPKSENNKLSNLFSEYSYNVTNINDNKDKRFPQSTPKQRILAALYQIKENFC